MSEYDDDDDDDDDNNNNITDACRAPAQGDYTFLH
jgi:hypothetical protein